jgi:hypothetical protein
MMVLDVRLEVVVETIDAGGEDRYLRLGGSGVALESLVIGDDFRLFLHSNCHCFSSSYRLVLWPLWSSGKA